MLVSRWLWKWVTQLGVRPCWSADRTRSMTESWSVTCTSFAVRARRCRLGGAASRCAALRAASCELLRRAARGWWPRVAREGWVTPRR